MESVQVGVAIGPAPSATAAALSRRDRLLRRVVEHERGALLVRE
jgi:hypothetical protein